MTELKPCPCCGPKAFITPSIKCDPQAGKHCWTAELRCHECGLNISRTAATEQEALYEAIKAWNTRAERTCKPKWKRDSQGYLTLVCDMCHKPIDYTDNFCAECGAKVVE